MRTMHKAGSLADTATKDQSSPLGSGFTGLAVVRPSAGRQQTSHRRGHRDGWPTTNRGL